YSCRRRSTLRACGHPERWQELIRRVRTLPFRGCRSSNHDSSPAQIRLRLMDRHFAKMKYRCREHGAGGAFSEALLEMIEIAGASLAPGVDRSADALAPETLGRLLHEVWIVHCGRVQRDFVCAGAQDLLNIIEVAQSAADRERNIDVVGHASDHLGNDVPAVG